MSRVLQARGQTLTTTTLVDDVPAIQADMDPDGLGSRTSGARIDGKPDDARPTRPEPHEPAVRPDAAPRDGEA